MAALIVSTTRAAVARRPTGIVKLIRHAKSADAAHGCPALLNGEEAAICSSPSTTRILCAPSSIIAGQRIHWRLRQHHCQRNECRYLSREAHCSLLVVTRNNNVGSYFFPALAFGPIQDSFQARLFVVIIEAAHFAILFCLKVPLPSVTAQRPTGAFCGSLVPWLHPQDVAGSPVADNY